MKQSHLLSILQNDFTTVHVAFRADINAASIEEAKGFSGTAKVNGGTVRTFTYKAPFTANIVVDDYVVVESPKGGPMVGLVMRVDEKANIDLDADFEYKWIVQRIDRTEYDARVKRDAAFIETMNEVEREAQKAKLIKKFADHLPEGSEARAKYEQAVAAAQAPLQIGKE